ncbi:MAG: alpha/beta fold hydrolase [Methyloceanibacter sp.]|uniref:alpha/beta fold hydrolase n=1 Tax=Methyloceanibacter sp. TaxID=1965321 RepID=UPI003EE3028B
MHFVFVHGWGFNAGVWADMGAYLPVSAITLIDLGFVAGGPASHEDWPDDAIAVGHSLGLMWLLKEGKGSFKGLVSIQGFDRFSPHVPEGRVAALKRGLARDPGGTMAAFWRSCGAPDFAPTEALNVARLDEGLDWLMHWDAEAAKKRLQCPILTLAARDDVIVPPAMSEAVWGTENIVWSPDGGHILPLRHPDWCARHVLEFANSVPS